MTTIPITRIPLKEHLGIQGQEINSSLNEWGAGEEFGHKPTDTEKMIHYINSGRAAEMRYIHSDGNVWLTGIRLSCDPITLSCNQRERELSVTYYSWHKFCKNCHQDCWRKGH